ncbi:unnamed protein product [Discula destructiva]
MEDTSEIKHAPSRDTSHGAWGSEGAQAQTRAHASPEPDTSASSYSDQGDLRKDMSNATQHSRVSSNQSPSDEYEAPDSYQNLDEVADSGPAQNVDEEAFSQYKTLEETRKREQAHSRDQDAEREKGAGRDGSAQEPRVSRRATQLYTVSHLIFFSFLGTLARLGLQALTDYPGAPVFPSVWFNFGGSLVMGFLAEDRMLFRNEWGTPHYDRQIRKAKHDADGADSDTALVDLAAAKKAHQATKKTIPLYIGLATGFCGSFTSFSSFVRDVFLALSNDLPQPGSKTTARRDGGYSFMAVLAVIIITVAASLSGLFVGAHIAIASEPFTPSLPYQVNRKIVDRLGVFLGWGCWLGAVLLSALPPQDYWRGDATFALVLAPLGTLARFYASLWLNGRKASFPLGTFVVNVFGTAVLGMAWDLQRAPLGGVVGCQVLQGIEDGFCGCLTTVSTWVAELSSLRRKHAWIYGGMSVLVSLGLMVVIMGGLRWTQGFAGLQCVH